MSCKVISPIEPKRYNILKDRFIEKDGSWKILPHTEYEDVTEDELRLICHKEALYGVVTTELVSWLQQRIRKSSTIEIGSGKTGLGRALGITMTDADIQSLPEQQIYYRMIGQPTIELLRDVKKMNADRAIKKYRPDTVIGMWVTQRWRPFMGDDAQASVYGIDEEKLLKRVRRYIVIGNDKIHGRKEIMRYPHDTYRFPWLLSRSEQSMNAIYVWER